VERVQEYIDIEQEPPAIIESHRPAPGWPHEGAVQIRNIYLRYAPDLPDVLKNVTFNILAHEKVAVVGRTGAGKSTLSLAFFRIIPLSGGSIVIDGEDISQLGLFDLRSRLTIIPQDPVLFNGTLRSNLDPLEQHDDEKLWEALRRVNFLESLQQAVVNPEAQGSSSNDTLNGESNSVTLDSSVAENGSNFSQGQRQLLCLARSLLQGNQIIFLDEATASVDNETDARIQTTIRQEFTSSTIICIAHRLRTIIDYDKVLVLDKGQVSEFGTPLDLIENSSVGMFRSMCEETGEFEELLEIARNAQIHGFKS
jgi:ABC-type multidrug transport system fused ATPase/permease subunit